MLKFSSLLLCWKFSKLSLLNLLLKIVITYKIIVVNQITRVIVSFYVLRFCVFWIFVFSLSLLDVFFAFFLNLFVIIFVFSLNLFVVFFFNRLIYVEISCFTSSKFKKFRFVKMIVFFFDFNYDFIFVLRVFKFFFVFTFSNLLIFNKLLNVSFLKNEKIERDFIRLLKSLTLISKNIKTKRDFMWSNSNK